MPCGLPWLDSCEAFAWARLEIRLLEGWGHAQGLSRRKFLAGRVDLHILSGIDIKV